ncbi:MAG: hypothetical protein LBW77_07385 [Verrucomicrobiota bacterium]|jgi:hypothetical protein|nr:hypothetical protein [Verrucomicrobiota bacterium]
MKKVLIIVEGPSDRAFVKAFIQDRFGAALDEDSVIVADPKGKDGGWTQLSGVLEQGQRYAQKDCVLVVFDTDAPSKDRGGYEARRAAIEEMLKKVPATITADVFLFPDNARDGDLETLLEEIVKHPELLDCWRGYETCVNGKRYHVPSRKSKIHEYAAAVAGPDVWKDQGYNKSFVNPDVWDFGSEALKPLKDFLVKHLKEENE